MEEAITGQCLHGSHISVRLCSVSMKLGLWMQYWRMAFIIRNSYKGSTSNYPKFNDLSWGTDLTEGMRWYSWQLCRRWGKRPTLPILQNLTSNMEEMPLSNHLAGTCHEHIPQHPSKRYRRASQITQLVKVPVTKLDDLSLISGTQMAEGKNQLKHVDMWLTHVTWNTHMQQQKLMDMCN